MGDDGQPTLVGCKQRGPRGVPRDNDSRSAPRIPVSHWLHMSYMYLPVCWVAAAGPCHVMLCHDWRVEFESPSRFVSILCLDRCTAQALCANPGCGSIVDVHAINVRGLSGVHHLFKCGVWGTLRWLLWSTAAVWLGEAVQ